MGKSTDYAAAATSGYASCFCCILLVLLLIFMLFLMLLLCIGRATAEHIAEQKASCVSFLFVHIIFMVTHQSMAFLLIIYPNVTVQHDPLSVHSQTKKNSFFPLYEA